MAFSYKLIIFSVYIGQILVGYGLGWTAPVIPKLQDPDQTPLPNVISDQEASWIGSLLFIGTITGNVFEMFTDIMCCQQHKLLIRQRLSNYYMNYSNGNIFNFRSIRDWFPVKHHWQKALLIPGRSCLSSVLPRSCLGQ